MKKIRVGILFGGRSAEHEVSLQSAKNVIDALDRQKFEPVLIGIDKTGTWHLHDSTRYLRNAESSAEIKLAQSDQAVALLPGHPSNQVDVVFPVLHGPLGEDGTIQGLLKLADLPFVGAGVLGSAIGMDKDVMKRLLRDAGIPVTKFLVFSDYEREHIRFEEVVGTLGLPCFVKPANMGSSVGISKANGRRSFTEAIEMAFKYDTKILIERAIVGSEVECAVLGNDQPIASLPGRIIPRTDFYSYDAKYLDEDGASLEIPAQLSKELTAEVQRLALSTFKVLACEGMARVDMFLTVNGEVIVNEINTIPGFTKISMYPKLWEASGLSYADLITRLIELAIERHEKHGRLTTSFR